MVIELYLEYIYVYVYVHIYLISIVRTLRTLQYLIIHLDIPCSFCFSLWKILRFSIYSLKFQSFVFTCGLDFKNSSHWIIKYTFNQKISSLLPLENSPFLIFNNFPLSSFTTLFFGTLISEMLDLLGCWLLFYLFFYNFCLFTFLFLSGNVFIFKYFNF